MDNLTIFYLREWKERVSKIVTMVTPPKKTILNYLWETIQHTENSVSLDNAYLDIALLQRNKHLAI